MIRDLIQILRTYWVNLHPFIRLIGVLGILIWVGLIITKPAYRTFKHWRMDRNLVAAQQAVDEKQMQKARDLSLTVLRSGDSNIQAFRILEKSAAALGDPRHGEIAHALILHPDGSEDDQLTGFLTVVETMPLGIVGRAWVELPIETRVRPHFATAFAKRLLIENRIGEAAQILLALPADARNSDVRQGLARILIASGKLEGFEEAQLMIAKGLAGSENENVPGWLDILEMLPIASIQESLLSPVRSLPEKAIKEYPARIALAVARVDCSVISPNYTPVLNQMIATWKDRSPELLARFLIDMEQHHLLLESYPVDGIDHYPKLLPLLLDAAETTEAWDDAERLLDASDGHMPKYLMLAHRALLAIKRADTNAGSEAWRAAIAEAKTDRTNHALLKLHKIAKDAGLHDFATSAMLDAIRAGRGPLPLYQDQKDLCQTLAQTGQDTALLEICAIYLNFEPSNPVLLTQYAYLACLNDVIEPARLLTPLKLLAKAFPGELPIHTTLATVHLSTGQADLASEVLAPFELQIHEMEPSFHIVFLVSQVLLGEIPANDPQIEKFPWNALLASERRKFSSLIRNMK